LGWVFILMRYVFLDAVVEPEVHGLDSVKGYGLRG
jgi:hypothetical protein